MAEPQATGIAPPPLEEALGWIGFRVDDMNGSRVARVQDIYVDTKDGEPVWVVVKVGRFGKVTAIPYADCADGAGPALGRPRAQGGPRRSGAGGRQAACPRAGAGALRALHDPPRPGPARGGRGTTRRRRDGTAVRPGLLSFRRPARSGRHPPPRALDRRPAAEVGEGFVELGRLARTAALTLDAVPAHGTQRGRSIVEVDTRLHDVLPAGVLLLVQSPPPGLVTDRISLPAPSVGAKERARNISASCGKACQACLQQPSWRAITICWTSSVPSPMVRILASR